MTREEKEIFALQAYPPNLEGNGMTWPFIDKNEPYRNKLIAALESMEANGMEISIGGKIRRDNTLSKKILEEVQPQGLDEAAEEQAKSFGYMSWDYEFNENVESFKAGAAWRDAQISKLPDNLDESAEVAYKKYLKESEDIEYLDKHLSIDMFKAGAEWQYQKDRAEFAKLKAKEWQNGFDSGVKAQQDHFADVSKIEGLEEAARLEPAIDEYLRVVKETSLRQIARYFAQWGAKWQAEQGVTVEGILYGGNLGIPDTIPEDFCTDKEEKVRVQITKK